MLRLPAENPVRASLAAIRDSGERAAALTGQLLAFSRRQILQVRPLDVNGVVTGAAKLLQRLIGEDVVLDVRPGAATPIVEADRHQIEQVLMNLAVNSRDASRTAGAWSSKPAAPPCPPRTPRATPGCPRGTTCCSRSATTAAA